MFRRPRVCGPTAGRARQKRSVMYWNANRRGPQRDATESRSRAHYRCFGGSGSRRGWPWPAIDGASPAEFSGHCLRAWAGNETGGWLPRSSGPLWVWLREL